MDIIKKIGKLNAYVVKVNNKFFIATQNFIWTKQGLLPCSSSGRVNRKTPSYSLMSVAGRAAVPYRTAVEAEKSLRKLRSPEVEIADNYFVN